FTEEAVRDPAIAAIPRRVAVREDPAPNVNVTRLKPAPGAVTPTGGRPITRLRGSGRGGFPAPHSEAEAPAEVRELAAVVLSPRAVTRVEGLVEVLDTLPRFSDFVAALTL